MARGLQFQSEAWLRANKIRLTHSSHRPISASLRFLR